jgi:hypothetical protein
MDVTTIVDVKDVPEAATAAIKTAAKGQAIKQFERSEVRAEIVKEVSTWRISKLSTPKLVYDAGWPLRRRGLSEGTVIKAVSDRPASPPAVVSDGRRKSPRNAVNASFGVTAASGLTPQDGTDESSICRTLSSNAATQSSIAATAGAAGCCSVRSVELIDSCSGKDRAHVCRRQAMQPFEQEAATVLGDLRITFTIAARSERDRQPPAARAVVFRLEHCLASPLIEVHLCCFPRSTCDPLPRTSPRRRRGPRQPSGTPMSPAARGGRRPFAGRRGLSCSSRHIDGRVAIKRLLFGLSIAMLHEDAEQRERIEVRALPASAPGRVGVTRSRRATPATTIPGRESSRDWILGPLGG